MTKNKNDSKFVVHSLKETDRTVVTSFLNIYLEDQPLFQQLKLTEEDQQAFIDVYINNKSTNIFSTGIFNRDTDELCGCGFAHFLNSSVLSDYYLKTNKQMSENLQKYVRFSNYAKSFITKETETDRVMYGAFGVIKSGYRGHGLATLYMEWLLDVGKQHNCDVAAGVVLVPPAYRAAQRMGSTMLKHIHYKDYRDPVTGEAVFARILPPITKAVVFIIRILKNSKL